MTTTSPRIFYVCHDNPKPAGGIRTLYRHVEILNRAGLQACILHGKPGFKPDWFESEARIIYAEALWNIKPHDWVVIPEDHARALEHFSTIHCHKIVFCQNHYYIFDTLPIDKHWADYGVETLLVSSKEIQNFVESVFSVPTTLMPYSIDRDIFRPPARAPQLSVCFMPRKGGSNLRTILGAVWQRAPELKSIPWRPVDGMHEDRVASVMRTSTLFLSTMFHEGFGLPPLEAMACGCLPVGFKAVGARDYANDCNGYWVPDEDPFALAQKLEQVLKDLVDNPMAPHFEQIRQSGYNTVERYSAHEERQSIMNFWKARI